MLETEDGAKERGAPVLGEVLGGGYASEALGLLAIRDDGDGLVRAMRQALDDAGLAAADVGMIVAHGNGTPQSDASRRRHPTCLRRGRAAGHRLQVGDRLPYVAAGMIETVLALRRCRATSFRASQRCRASIRRAPASASPTPRVPRSKVALILCRGFAGTNAALIVRAA